MRRYVLMMAACCVIWAAPGLCGDLELARIEHQRLEDLRSQVFTLAGETRVGIQVTSLRDSADVPIPDVWILDSATREKVWDVDQAEQTERRRKTLVYEDFVTLPGGRYEIYSSTFTISLEDRAFATWLVSTIKRWLSGDDLEEEIEHVEVVVSGRGSAGGVNTPERVRQQLAASAFVAFSGVGDDEYHTQGFTLTEDAAIRVYALGEGFKDSAVDSGWIIDAGTRKTVWRLDYWDSKRAGGAKKNRVVDDVIELPAGDYAAFYASDDSHSCRRFNATPPRDPWAWGMTLSLVDPAASDAVSLVDFEDPLDRNTIVALTRVGDDELRSQGFTLERPTEVLVYAIGEGSGGRMHDYGWILDASSRETVWSMSYGHTEHAGGAEKNRVVQDVISLPAGSYLVHYCSDGSHSYAHWNAGQPFDRERWGITLAGASPDFSRDQVSSYAEAAGPDALARISEVRKRANETSKFSLDRDTRVLVYAVGEGSGGDMYDYGWIEDSETGETVWEMEYRDTERAGGAKKNRVVRESLTLPAGSYALRYRSDGSHSFGDWNSAPPDDPTAWGIAVFPAE